MSTDTPAYPLTWPVGWQRTETRKRQRARFGQGTGNTTIGRSLNARLRPELQRLGATDVVISTNIPVRLDGLPYASAREPDDPGVAIYFRIKGQPRCLACDRWDRVADNMAALAKHIEAIRGIGRWGVGTVEQVMSGYKALTAADARKPWWEVLGFKTREDATAERIEAKRRELAMKHHPDRGGSASQMAEINAAADEGAREV